MTPDALRAAAARLNMTGIAMAAALGVHKRTYRRWLAGQPIPHWVPVMIAAMQPDMARQSTTICERNAK